METLTIKSKPYKQARRLLRRNGKYGNRYYYYDTDIETEVVFHKSTSKNKCIELIAYTLQNPV